MRRKESDLLQFAPQFPIQPWDFTSPICKHQDGPSLCSPKISNGRYTSS
jgi:hypothetical protein